jgi:chromosome partitioning protein
VARVIAVVGSKGGTGKSSISHLIGHGAGSMPRMIPCVVLTTDPEEVPRDDRRRYVVVDARSERSLLAEMERLLPEEKLLIVIDGAAARRDLDAIVADVADIALLPFGPSAQDAERTKADLARLPNAHALPNRWPKHPGVAKRARRWLTGIPESRCMAPFPSIPRLDGLLSDEGYREAAYELASPARSLLLEVLARGRIDPFDLTETIKAGHELVS